MDINLERFAEFMARMIEKYGNQVNLDDEDNESSKDESSTDKN